MPCSGVHSNLTTRKPSTIILLVMCNHSLSQSVLHFKPSELNKMYENYAPYPAGMLNKIMYMYYKKTTIM